MPTQRLNSLLAGGTLAPLCAESKRTRELQRVFCDSAPAPLVPAVRVKRLKAGTLYLSADNAAVAAKLRQLAPRLLQTIRERVPEVTGIRVDVQVNAAAYELKYSVKKSGLSIETIEKFNKLAASIPDSDLRSAIVALVHHHGAKRRAPP